MFHALWLAAFSLAMLSGPLLNGETLAQKDANLLQVPFLQSHQLNMRVLHQPPLWNPSLWLGAPSLAHPLFTVFSPASLLTLVLPVPAAFAWGLFLVMFFSGMAMLLLARALGCGPGAGLVAAAAYAFGGFALGRVGAPTGPGIEYLHSFAFAPLALALALRAVDERRLAHAMPFGLSLLFVMNGNPNLLYYTAILCVTVLAGRVLVEPGKAWLALALLSVAWWRRRDGRSFMSRNGCGPAGRRFHGRADRIGRALHRPEVRTDLVHPRILDIGADAHGSPCRNHGQPST